ncbi:MAG: hypothetical protein KDE19_23545, partial [Caldilineaceae bacterium]|nr:hypothetical protein [Caldilineaceae bacterium]
VGNLSAPQLFLLSRRERDEPWAERAMEWFTGFAPLRTREVNFAPVPLLQPSAQLNATNGPSSWQKLLFSNDQSLLLAATPHTVNRWQLANEQAMDTVAMVNAPITDMALDRADHNLAYTDQQGKVYLRNLATNSEQLIAEHGAGAAFVRFSFGDNAVISVGEDGMIALYEIATGQSMLYCTTPPLAITALATDPTGPNLAYASADNNIIHIWNSSNNTPIADLPGHSDQITLLNYRWDGQAIISASRDRTVRIWPIEHGAASIVQMNLQEQPLYASFLANSPLFVIGTASALRLWRLDQATSLTRKSPSIAGISAVSASNDGTLIATAAQDGAIVLWQVDPEGVLTPR